MLLGFAFDRCARAMMVVDENSETIFANPAAGRLLETESSSLIGHTSIPAPDLRRDANQTDGEAVTFLEYGLDHREWETTLQTPAGGVLQLEMCADLVSTSGGRRLFLIQLLDITEDRLRRAQLSSSELRYLQVTSNLPRAAVVLFDHDLRFILAFGEVLGTLGQGPDFLEGRLVREILSLAVLELLEPAYRAALAGHASDFEFTSPIHGGQIRIQVRPVTGPDGTVISGMATSEEVSQARGRESRLQQIRSLTPFGTCQYDPLTRWIFDSELLQLWGVDAAVDPLEVINERVYRRIGPSQSMPGPGCWPTAVASARNTGSAMASPMGCGT